MTAARLLDRVSIVSGAASGVGAEAARLFENEGAVVIACDLRRDALEAAHASRSECVVLVEADVRSQNDVERLVELSWSRFGRIDVLLNNAGVTVRAPLEETTDEIWQAAIDVNLRAAVRLTRAVVPFMRLTGSGSIVNIASITSLEGVPSALAYSAAKGGLVAATRALAVELAPDGIRVNAICPGGIDSPMTHEYLASTPDPEEALARQIARHPLGRLASPLEVAHAALFLASSEASFITGVALPVDGGRSIS